MQRGEIRALTGLRGVAAVYVALYHIHWISVTNRTSGALLGHGYLAVDAFFVLSGYVMALTYASYFDRGWRPAQYAEFLIRRVARVWPLYILVVLALSACFALHLLARSPPSLAQFAYNATLTQLWVGARELDEPTWSVSAELAAYLLFPAILMALSARRPRANAAAAAALALGLAALPTMHAMLTHGAPAGGNGPFDLSSAPTIIPLLRCLLEFSLGVCVFRLKSPGVMRVMSSPQVSILLLCAVLALLCVRGADIPIVLLLPLVVLSLSSDSPVALAVFGNPVVYALGLWSYALYLIHFHSNKIHTLAAHVLHRFGRFGDVSAWLVQYAVLIGGAALLYAVIERPGQRLFRSLGARLHGAVWSREAKDAAAGARSA